MRTPDRCYDVGQWRDARLRDADWGAPGWAGAGIGRLAHVMPGSSAHRPKVRFRLAYDEHALYLIFCVKDRFVRAAVTQPQGSVCRDSCVEFFFAPGEDPSAGYFNFEINCIGTMLCHFQQKPRISPVPLSAEALSSIDVFASLTGPIEDEIVADLNWSVACRVPLAVLAPYCVVLQPALGAEWRGNFYKCADDTSQPHWLTWAPVDRPHPDFHVPECFGQIRFGA